MSTRTPYGMIFARVDPELRDRVKAEANQRFEGNTSLVVRDAVRTYLRLRDHLGTRFDAAIDEMAPIERTEESAA